MTTVLIGSCSLSTVHVGGTDAGDLFGRVEAIPREHVIDTVDEREDLDAVHSEYVAALEALPLGPNLAAFIGHSDMRTATMGLDRATRKAGKAHRGRAGRDGADARPRRSTPASSGMSSQQLLFDKIDGDIVPLAHPAVDLRQAPRAAPAQVPASAPGPGAAVRSGHRQPAQTCSPSWHSRFRFCATRCKTSLLSAADVKSNPFAIALLGPLARSVNRFGADFRWQHLPVPFEVYADGIDLVVFEEFGAGAAALHLRDEVERNALLQDEGYRRRFRKDYDSKFGMRVWHRDFFDAEIVECPDESVIGKSFGQVGVDRGDLHPVDAFLDLVVEHGTETALADHDLQPPPRRAAEAGPR